MNQNDLTETPISRRRLFSLGGVGVLGAGLGYLGYKQLSGPRFRINTVESPTPAIEPSAFRLEVAGMVERPATYTLDQVLALPSVEQVSDFHCVEGWGVPNVHWQGVRFQTLAELVGAKPGATFVTFSSEGGVYRDSLALNQAMQPDMLLAYAMDGAPLPQKHGYPLRVVMPRMYGYKGAKWLTRIEFGTVQEAGYWEQRGWKIDGWIA